VARRIEITPCKTYKTPQNAVKAVERVIPPEAWPNLRYFIMTHTDGRFFPVFVGQETMRAGVHFRFNCIG